MSADDRQRPVLRPRHPGTSDEVEDLPRLVALPDVPVASGSCDAEQPVDR